MRLLLVVLLVATSGCKSAERKEQPAPAPAADGAPERAVDVADDLADDLEGLAEMPELTAEATEAEINRRVDRVLDAFTAFIDLLGEHRDCEDMGRALSRFADAHQQFFSSLERLNRPDLQKRLAERLTERGSEWLAKMSENLHRCASHPSVSEALAKLSRQR